MWTRVVITWDSLRWDEEGGWGKLQASVRARDQGSKGSDSGVRLARDSRYLVVINGG
jgi:hypothetical protein